MSTESAKQAVPAHEDLRLPERLALKTLVEACLVLEDGEASAKDIEVGMMMGAGILPGPFARADEQGLDTLVESLERAASEWGEDFEPPLVLRRLVAQGRLGRKSGQGFFAYPDPDDGQSRETVALETRGDVGVVWLDRPPANPLSPQLIGELTEVWNEVDGTLRAVVFASSNIFTFSAGADIKEFTKMSEEQGRELLDARTRAVPLVRALLDRHDRRRQLAGLRRRLRAGHGLRRAPGRPSPPPSGSPRWTWGSSPASAAPSGCRAWWGRPGRWR